VVFILSGPHDYGHAVIEYTRTLTRVFVTYVGRPEYIRCDLTVEPLRQLLAASGVCGPYILAGHSFGGLTALCFQQRWPNEVAGLLLLDSTHPDQTSAALELLPPQGSLFSGPIEEFRRYIMGFGPVYDNSCEYARRISSVGATPLIAIAAGCPDMPSGIIEPLRSQLTRCWHRLQTGYARLSASGQVRIIPGVGHDLMGQAPEACRQAIKDLLLLYDTKKNNSV
jgi:pimeloyl-ACP methyl ester carboxylesterase